MLYFCPANFALTSYCYGSHIITLLADGDFSAILIRLHILIDHLSICLETYSSRYRMEGLGVNYLKVATCNLNQWAMDFDHNLSTIIESLRVAKAANAAVRVGPELEVWISAYLGDCIPHNRILIPESHPPRSSPPSLLSTSSGNLPLTILSSLLATHVRIILMNQIQNLMVGNP